MRDVEATMPAIAPIEDFRAAQNGLRSMFLAVFPLQFAPYDLRSIGNGGASGGRMCANCGYRSALPKN
jgi:hypothetical protein